MSVLRVAPRTAVVLVLASAAALATFTWPFFVPAHPESTARTGEAPLVFLVVLPVLVALVLAELSSGGIDSKALAMLGVLAAVNAALRPLGAGTAGIETVFFLLVLAGRVFGPGFGFLLGSTSLFASALLTAGSGRGCRSRCWPRPGSVSAPACYRRGCGAGPRSLPWPATASSRPTATDC